MTQFKDLTLVSTLSAFAFGIFLALSANATPTDWTII